nr:unnamed protein product [Digitaria exilis]
MGDAFHRTHHVPSKRPRPGVGLRAGGGAELGGDEAPPSTCFCTAKNTRRYTGAVAAIDPLRRRPPERKERVRVFVFVSLALVKGGGSFRYSSSSYLSLLQPIPSPSSAPTLDLPRESFGWRPSSPDNDVCHRDHLPIVDISFRATRRSTVMWILGSSKQLYQASNTRRLCHGVLFASIALCVLYLSCTLIIINFYVVIRSDALSPLTIDVLAIVVDVTMLLAYLSKFVGVLPGSALIVGWHDPIVARVLRI